MFQVSFSSLAEKVFGKLSQKLKQKIYDELKELSKNPFTHSQVRRIKNTELGYRLRVGRWRILFALFKQGKEIEVVDIFLKKGEDDYKKRKYLLR